MLALDSLFGLPAHPFLVHIPVVLIPLAALGAVLMLWPRLRQSVGWWVCAIVVVAGIATQLAISSGEALEEHVQESHLVRDHTRMGENIRPWLLLMFLALLGVMLCERMISRRAVDGDEKPDLLKIAQVALSVLSLVFAGVSVYWVYRIGHSGSKAVWHNTQVRIDHGQSNPDPDGPDDG
jgi:uncharacterized membrane protein